MNLLLILAFLTMEDKKETILVGASNSLGLKNYVTCIDRIVAGKGWTAKDQYEAVLPYLPDAKILVINPDGNGTLELHKKYVQAMVDEAKKYNVKVILLNIGPRERTDTPSKIARHFNKICADKGFFGVDRYLQIDIALKDLVIGRHWIVVGRERVADLICRAIENL